MAFGAGVTRAKVDVALGFDQRADAAAAAVLRRLLSVVIENVDGALHGVDTEYLHQLRIAVRRSRTVQRQLKRVFPKPALPGYRTEFRWLQRATGDARDLDVYVEEFDGLRDMLPERQRADLDPLRLVLIGHQLTARGRLGETLRSRRATELFADWDRLLESLVELPMEERRDAQRPVGPLVGERVHTVYETIVAMGSEIGDSSPAEAYHALRKKGKELRYLLELFAVGLFPADAVDPLVRSLKDLQELLGRHQDREVQVAMLRSLADEVAALPRGPAACMAMGVLVDRLADDERAARAEFSHAFAELSSASRRIAVAEAFLA